MLAMLRWTDLVALRARPPSILQLIRITHGAALAGD